MSPSSSGCKLLVILDWQNLPRHKGMSVPRLPVLKGGGVDQPNWRRYVRWVYGEDVPTQAELDLNAFSWFYWNAPLPTGFQPVWRDSPWSQRSSPLAPNTAWTCSIPILPECKFSPFGFFVSREQPDAKVEAWTRTGRIEVLRVKFHEAGAAWFYHAVGSGVFLNLDALPVNGRTLLQVGDPPNLGLWDAGVGAYMQERDCNLLIITDRFADRRVEIVVRGASLDAPLDSTCPFLSSAFSTGLATQQRCECSGDVTLLNCRADVSSYLRTRQSSLWMDYLIQCTFFLLTFFVLLASFVALAMQERRSHMPDSPAYAK